MRMHANFLSTNEGRIYFCRQTGIEENQQEKSVNDVSQSN